MFLLHSEPPPQLIQLCFLCELSLAGPPWSFFLPGSWLGVGISFSPPTLPSTCYPHSLVLHTAYLMQSGLCVLVVFAVQVSQSACYWSEPGAPSDHMLQSGVGQLTLSPCIVSCQLGLRSSWTPSRNPVWTQGLAPGAGVSGLARI